MVRKLVAGDAPTVSRMYMDVKGYIPDWPGGSADLDNAGAKDALKKSTLAYGEFVKGRLTGFVLFRESTVPTINTKPPMPESYYGRPVLEVWLWGTALDLGRGGLERTMDAIFARIYALTPGRRFIAQVPYDAFPDPGRAYCDKTWPEHYDYWLHKVHWRIWTGTS